MKRPLTTKMTADLEDGYRVMRASEVGWIVLTDPEMGTIPRPLAAFSSSAELLAWLAQWHQALDVSRTLVKEEQ